MKRHWRRIVTAIFVVAFLVTMPLVLLMTAGYRYNDKRGRVEMTGIVQARSNPRDATVIVNGQQQAKTTPVEIRRLLAEDYVVRLVKDGYLPWEKTLRVDAGQTAFTGDVNLLRDSLPRLVLEGRFLPSSWSPNGRQLAFVRDGDGFREVGLWSVTGDTATLARIEGAAEGQEDSLAWSPDGNRLLVVSPAVKRTSLTVHFPGTNREPLVLDRLLPPGPLTAGWAPDGQAIIVHARTVVYLMSADGSEAAPLAIGDGVLDATTRDHLVFVIRRDAGVTWLERVTSGRPERLLTLPDDSCRFIEWRGLTLVIADERRGRLLLVGTDGILRNEMSGLHFSERSDGQVVLWNSFEILVGDLATGKTELVTRLGTPISNCEWHPSGSHVFCTTSDTLLAFEVDGRGVRNTWELVKVTGAGPLRADEIGPTLRFTGTIGNVSGLFERDL
jgi:hypothetical protein